MKQQKNTVEQKGNLTSSPAALARDISNRNILKDPVLCIQFLKDYVDNDLFKDLKPEDIEDESQKYQAYLGIAFETDTVKKIRMQDGTKGKHFYLISLVEHKSDVDYNVSMQILRYMVCIWHEYGKEMTGLKKGNRKNKSFRYPPILPIVYYEGTGRWTAPMHLKDRIMMKELFEDYIPDFTYKLIRNHDYSNDELLHNDDEMSLLMMLGKAQTPEDIHNLVNADQDKVTRIIQRAPEQILELIADTVWNLCMKMNVPQNEAEECVKKVRERQMGYWFENMEKMDIQAERRNTAEAHKEAEKAKAEAERAKADAEKAKAKVEEVHEDGIRSIVSICQELGANQETAVEKLIQNYHLDHKTALEKAVLYWNPEKLQP